MSRDFDIRLTTRQEAAFRSIAARHPRPVTSAQLASELQIAEGSLNVTLRSLRRRGLIGSAPETPGRRGGWTLEQS